MSPDQQPEPELQQVTKTAISIQGCSTADSIATITCFYSRNDRMFALIRTGICAGVSNCNIFILLAGNYGTICFGHRVTKVT